MRGTAPLVSGGALRVGGVVLGTSLIQIGSLGVECRFFELCSYFILLGNACDHLLRLLWLGLCLQSAFVFGRLHLPVRCLVLGSSSRGRINSGRRGVGACDLLSVLVADLLFLDIGRLLLRRLRCGGVLTRAGPLECLLPCLLVLLRLLLRLPLSLEPFLFGCLLLRLRLLALL